jgi:hypothetical protein
MGNVLLTQLGFKNVANLIGFKKFKEERTLNTIFIF